MREVADRARIEAFLAALAHEATAETTIYVVGGTSAVLVGWRQATIDVDLVMRPESDAMLRAIPSLKEKMQLNVELASPDQFIPVPPGWEEREARSSRGSGGKQSGTTTSAPRHWPRSSAGTRGTSPTWMPCSRVDSSASSMSARNLLASNPSCTGIPRLIRSRSGKLLTRRFRHESGKRAAQWGVE